MPEERTLLIVGTHPIQYHAPVYRCLYEQLNVSVHMIYASDFSVRGYFDPDFRTWLAWDTDLFTPPERCTFLSRVSEGGAQSCAEISAKGLGKRLAQINPGAVLLTGYAPSFHLHAFWQAARRRLPILFRAETTTRNRVRGWKQQLRIQMLRRMYQRCDRLLPIGEESYQHYREFGCPEEKLVFSRYCVSTDFFLHDPEMRGRERRRVREQLGFTEDQLVIVFSGKLIPHKRPRLLLESIRRLPDFQDRKLAVLFLGSGAEQETIAAEAAREPSIPVAFAGFRNQTELSPFYAASDLLALPSISETWGLVVNEALHHGIPCVVTDTVGCARDLIKPGVTGEIASGSVDSFSAALARGLRLAGCDRVAADCRALIENYTVEKAARGIRDAYLQTVEARNR